MQSLGEKFLKKANLQSESVPGIPLIELYGKSRIYMEYHKGIIQYTEHEITIQSGLGSLRAEGEQLEISCISEQYLVITGKIRQVRWEDE